MSNISNTTAGLELAQIGWVVPDIHAAVKFVTNALGIAGFPNAVLVRAQDLDMTYYGEVVAGEWLTTQVYHKRSGSPDRANGFLRHLPDAWCCYRDHGCHTRGVLAFEQMQKTR